MLTIWRRHFTRLEFWLALAVSAGLVSVDRFVGDHPISGLLDDNRGSVYAVMVTLWGALLGFAITAVSIVFAFLGEARLKLIRESGHYADLWAIFVRGVRALAFATVAALAALLFDRDRPHDSAVVMFYILVFASLLAALRVWRIVWVLEKLVGIMAARSPARLGAPDADPSRPSDSP
jgi:hypothetical protein